MATNYNRYIMAKLIRLVQLCVYFFRPAFLCDSGYSEQLDFLNKKARPIKSVAVFTFLLRTSATYHSISQIIQRIAWMVGTATNTGIPHLSLSGFLTPYPASCSIHARKMDSSFSKTATEWTLESIRIDSDSSAHLWHPGILGSNLIWQRPLY